MFLLGEVLKWLFGFKFQKLECFPSLQEPKLFILKGAKITQTSKNRKHSQFYPLIYIHTLVYILHMCVLLYNFYKSGIKPHVYFITIYLFNFLMTIYVNKCSFVTFISIVNYYTVNIATTSYYWVFQWFSSFHYFKKSTVTIIFINNIWFKKQFRVRKYWKIIFQSCGSVCCAETLTTFVPNNFSRMRV